MVMDDVEARRGGVFRTQVEPLGTTVQTESSTNLPWIGYRLPLFHMIACTRTRPGG